MVQLGRLLRQWPILNEHYCAFATFQRLLLSPSFPAPTKTTLRRFSSSTRVHSANRNLNRRSRGLRLPKAPTPSDPREVEGGSDSESSGFKSRNQLKREAQRAVRWGMDLASFSTPQIKRILRFRSSNF